MNNTRLKELLEKYLDGTATETEIREVDNWYRSFENDPSLTDQFSPEQLTALEQLIFLRTSRQLEAAASKGRIRYIYNRWWAAAAVVVLIAAGGFYLMRNQSTRQEKAITAVTEQTDRSSIKKITLPDGSLLWLNVESKVKYTEHKGREVWLEGEGYFEVVPQQGQPFLVHAGTLDVNVLGTSFNIDAYTPAEKITVTVTSGKVAVGKDAGNTMTLGSDQQAVYYAAAGQLKKNGIAAADFSAWRQGQLIFKKALFRDIAQRLERRYDVRIRFASEHIASSLLTASFDANVPLKDVLGMLCDIYGFSYRQEPGKNEYLVYKKDQPGK